MIRFNCWLLLYENGQRRTGAVGHLSHLCCCCSGNGSLTASAFVWPKTQKDLGVGDILFCFLVFWLEGNFVDGQAWKQKFCSLRTSARKENNNTNS
jgi:hypothetical protein